LNEGKYKMLAKYKNYTMSSGTSGSEIDVPDTPQTVTPAAETVEEAKGVWAEYKYWIIGIGVFLVVVVVIIVLAIVLKPRPSPPYATPQGSAAQCAVCAKNGVSGACCVTGSTATFMNANKQMEDLCKQQGGKLVTCAAAPSSDHGFSPTPVTPGSAALCKPCNCLVQTPYCCKHLGSALGDYSCMDDMQMQNGACEAMQGTVIDCQEFPSTIPVGTPAECKGCGTDKNSPYCCKGVKTGGDESMDIDQINTGMCKSLSGKLYNCPAYKPEYPAGTAAQCKTCDCDSGAPYCCYASPISNCFPQSMVSSQEAICGPMNHGTLIDCSAHITPPSPSTIIG
jgi:hypothetical protein